jgi:hypothetical protein
MAYLNAANIILDQLGSNQFIAMTGAKNFVGSEDGLSFKIGRNAKGITHVTVALDESDTYLMQFFKVRGFESFLVAENRGVYADKMREVFTEKTGMDTSL